MHAYLLIGKDIEEIKKKAEEIARKNDATTVPFIFSSIKDARSLIRFTSLATHKKTAIFLENIDKASVDAMNSFLKTLEEKNDFIFILTASNKQNVLPTILSRVEIIRLKGFKVSDKAKEKAEEFLRGNTTKRIAMIDSVKVKTDAHKFLDALFFTIDEKIAKNPSPEIAKIASKAIKLKKALSANTNTFLQLLNFVVSIDES